MLPGTEDADFKGRSDSVISAFKSDKADAAKGGIGMDFRRFAESTGADLGALTAVMISFRQDHSSNVMTKGALKKIRVPLMTVVGTDDFLPGDKAAMVKVVPGACHFQIQGKDHLTVISDPRFYMVVKAFLNDVNSK